MLQLNWAGILLIGGFVLVLVASLAGPPGLYQEPDPQQRLAIVAGHQGRWVGSNILFALAGVATAVGLVLFSLRASGDANLLLNWLAAGTYVLGTALWILFLYNRTLDPAQLFEDYTFSASTIALLGLLIGSLLLYGIVYIQAGYPDWLGWGTAVLTALIGLLAIVMPGRFFASFPPQVLYLFTLAAGIVFVRQ